MINLEEGEYIVAKFRKHWWKITTWGVSIGILAVVPFFFLIAFVYLLPSVDLQRWINLLGLAYSLWLTVLWILFYIEWTDYYLDVWLVTNARVIDIDHEGLFARTVSTVRLEDIEDITTEAIGILATVFKFGVITLQTAGSQNEFFLRDAANPEYARKVIYDLVNDVKRHHGGHE